MPKVCERPAVAAIDARPDGTTRFCRLIVEKTHMSGRRWLTLALAVVVAAGVGTTAGIAPAAAQPGSPARPGSPAGPASAVRSTTRPAASSPPAGPAKRPIAKTAGAVKPVPGGDEIVTATADAGGYHLFAASAAGGWRWGPLATLRPGGPSIGEPWTGQHCLTGDGRYVIAVVAPWRAQNSAAGFAAGGLAYAVDAHTGAVRPLVAGVSLAYFDPGCGAGPWAAFTRYLGADQARTSVLVADAATGRMSSLVPVSGEVTSAIATGRRQALAARGNAVVRLTRTAMTTAARRLPGQVYQLSVDRSGDAHFLTRDNATTASAWRLRDARATRTAHGPLRTLGVSAGAKIGVAAAVSRAGAVAVPRSGVRPGVAPIRRVRDGADLTAKATGGALPAPAPAATAMPAAWPPSPNTSAPTCAIPRNDPGRQVRQPSSAMIEWASNQAGRGVGTFTGEFPLPAPFDGGAHVPREVLDGVMAQESNWNQASPHAPPGIPGNPYVADYYGSYASGTVDYNQADCGYGLGQVTDGMRLTDPADTPTQIQIDVASDYRANVARAAQILAQKWTELSAAGITVGLSDPSSIEDWYLALWDYNSGLHADDGAGNRGLGWANNPANPVYDPARNPFLRVQDPLTGIWTRSYGDAAHPAGWPYQEKVLGWIETSQVEPSGTATKFAGTADYAAQTGFLTEPAHNDFCALLANSCLKGLDGSGTCTRSDYHCWWHDAWLGCGLFCHHTVSTVADDAPEPGVGNPHPAVCDLSLPAGTVVVDDEPDDSNLVGCSPGWRSTGDFEVAYNTDPASGGPTGKIDWHQLGAGFGGHFWFTHTEPIGSKYAQTGYWNPALALANYQVRVFIPDLGAVATARYEIFPGGGSPATYVDVDQSAYTNQWVSLGVYELGPGASVSLSSETSGGTGSVDLAYDAAAFTPVSAASVPYTAMGDSYSSGVGGDSYDAGTDTSTNRCRRSPGAFGRQYALSAGIGVDHIACSGATTATITGTGQYGEPRQLDQIPPSTSTISVTIGGNDIGFGDVLTRCVTPGFSCEGYYNNDDANNLQNVIDDLRPTLAATYRQIQAKAPAARVVAVTYPIIFAPGQTCANIGGMSVDDTEWLIDAGNYLDNIIVAAARDAGVQSLDVRYAFVGHELCSSQPWVKSLPIPLPNDHQVFDWREWFHPTTDGYAAIAGRLGAFLSGADAAREKGRPSLTPGVIGPWPPRNIPPGVPSTADARIQMAAINATPGRVVAAFSPGTTYDRDQFGDWRQRKNCDMRQRILRRDALTAAQLAPGQLPLALDSAQCKPQQGSWDWVYDLSASSPTPNTHSYPSESALAGTGGIQIDHIVTLENSWDAGAWNWTRKRRLNFANDDALPQLWAVSQASNGSKGGRSPNVWMPPNDGTACVYVKAWIAVKYAYALQLTRTEYDFLDNQLHHC